MLARSKKLLITFRRLGPQRGVRPGETLVRTLELLMVLKPRRENSWLVSLVLRIQRTSGGPAEGDLSVCGSWCPGSAAGGAPETRP